MVNLSTRKAKLSFTLTVLIVVISIIFFLLRGPYLSNYIKRMIIPVLENVSRERIIIDKAVINLFPFYVQAKGFKVFDKDGNRLLWVTKSRAYIDLLGLLSKEVRIRRLTLKEPDITVSESDLKRIMDNVAHSSSTDDGGEYTVSIKSVKLTDGNLKYGYKDGASGIAGTGLFIDMTSKNDGPVIHAILDKGRVRLPNSSELKGSIEGKFQIKDDKFIISSIELDSSKSSLAVQGEVNLLSDGRIDNGSLSGKVEIDVDTINTIFSLQEKKDGLIVFEGDIALKGDKESPWPRLTFNIKTRSSFYLETLMEIVKVKDNIKGKFSLNGKITGTFPDIIGKGRAELDNAVFTTLPVNDLRGNIAYRHQKFSLSEFTARTYDGTVTGNAHITIPDADYFINADLTDINSEKFFTFIAWDAPFQPGSISGHLQLDKPYDAEMFIKADIQYINTTEKGDDVLARLKTIFANIELRDNVLWLQDSILSSIESSLLLDGPIDFNKDTLQLEMLLYSENASDITSPDYKRFIAPVRFIGMAAGPLDGLWISGRLEADSGSIHEMEFSSAFADLTYSIKSLEVKQLMIDQDDAQYDLSGTLSFRGSKELFSFSDPYYRGEALINKVNIAPFITAAYKELPIKGKVDGEIFFEGDVKNYKAWGDVTVNSVGIYGQKIDAIHIKPMLYPDRIDFLSIKGNKGETVFNAEGTQYYNGQYEFTFSSDKIRLADYTVFSDQHINADVKLNMKGSGTLDMPNLEYSMIVTEGVFRDIDFGEGMIIGSLENDEVLAKGSFADAAVTTDMKVTLGEEEIWSLDVQVRKKDYSFLISGLIKDPPRDLSLTLEGDISINGKGNELSVNSRFDSIELSLYGYSLRNKDEIVMELRDNEYKIKTFVLTGDNAELRLSGSMKLNKHYDLSFSGNMELAPLRILSDNMSSIRGVGKFDVAMSGTWKNPQLEGEINLNEAAAVLSDSPYKIGPVNGIIYFKKDRITFDSLNVQYAGGNIQLSGVGYFKNMKMTRLFVSSDIDSIKIRPAEGVSSELDGQLFYESSPEGSALTGDLQIIKAKYEKDIEWKSWLFGLSEMKEDNMKYPGILSDTDLNIRVVSDNIIVDNNIAKTPIRMSVNVTGNVGEIGLIGRMEANEGKIFFRSNEFNVLEGSSVDFIKPNSIEPMFHIVADTYASEYYVRLSMDGTIDKFTLTLYSDPPLAETEILTLLTFGQIDKEAKGFESGIAASEATALLTGNLQDEVEEEFKYITGFERFEIEPHTTTSGAFSPKVTIGKHLLENQILVTYSSTIGTVEEQLINVEYKLNENLSLIGSRNEIGSAGVDFKYRFEFR